MRLAIKKKIISLSIREGLLHSFNDNVINFSFNIKIRWFIDSLLSNILSIYLKNERLNNFVIILLIGSNGGHCNIL